MPETKLNDTQPGPAVKDTQPTAVKPNGDKPGSDEKGKNFPRWLAILIILLLVGLGLLSGYGSGMGQRYDAQDTQITGQLEEQFQLAVEMMKAGSYDLAKAHFDFIIQNDPGYPGVMEAYADLLIRMQTSPTPTMTATSTVSPTPDLRGAEEIYASLKTAMAASDWNVVLTHLDSLRKSDPTYRTAEVDGLYFLALRMRGVDKILLQEGELCADINLEGGIYDLTLAERFGTLDAVAESLRTSSRLYIIGASYWDQDWQQAQYFFEQVKLGTPSLRDSSCETASERWRYATIKRAGELMAAGDSCGAEEQFNLAFSMTSEDNADYFPTATENSIQCDGGVDEGGGEESTPMWTQTETPTASIVTP